ncbi:hypothetical protein, partial [Streptomyces sp. NPDC058953]
MSEHEGPAGEVTGPPSVSPPSVPSVPTHPRHPSGPALPGTPPDDGLPGLLALVGRLLEGHAPAEIAVLLCEELDRREIEAYAKGWREAAAEYGPALEEALAAARPLRLVGRTPGQAAVIPFPHDYDSPGRRDQRDEHGRGDLRDPHGGVVRDRAGAFPGDEEVRRRAPEE